MDCFWNWYFLSWHHIKCLFLFCQTRKSNLEFDCNKGGWIIVFIFFIFFNLKLNYLFYDFALKAYFLKFHVNRIFLMKSAASCKRPLIILIWLYINHIYRGHFFYKGTQLLLGRTYLPYKTLKFMTWTHYWRWKT